MKTLILLFFVVLSGKASGWVSRSWQRRGVCGWGAYPLLDLTAPSHPLPMVASSATGDWQGEVSSVNEEENVIVSPVLKQVYPKMMEYYEKYGHANIPLGSTEGKKCKTLRRLHIQQKLTEQEINLLKGINFTFSSMEDVYLTGDFDAMLPKLLAYEEEYQDQYQIPKKYKRDPELGAWVTGIRRLGPKGVDPVHAERLDAVNFTWKSKRKCGSKFMQQYRAIGERIEKVGQEAVLADAATQEWIKAQRKTYLRGTLSEARQHYMATLCGRTDWYEDD